MKQEKVEDKKSSEEPPEKERKIVPIYRISAPFSVMGVIDDKDWKKERLKDDHPLKELRYCHSYLDTIKVTEGSDWVRIFSPKSPPSFPIKVLDELHLDLAIRRVELVKKLR